jgi:hypothetical protein
MREGGGGKKWKKPAWERSTVMVLSCNVEQNDSLNLNSQAWPMAKVGILFLNRKPLPATPRLPQAMSLPFCDAMA